MIIYKFPLGFFTDLCATDLDSDRLYPRVTISALSDDILVEIFVHVVGTKMDNYLFLDGQRRFEGRWHTLVHVCKRWRSVVFSSPRRLDLRLFLHKQKTSEGIARHLAAVAPFTSIAILPGN